MFFLGGWFVVVLMSGSARFQSSHCIYKEAGPGFYFPPGFSSLCKGSQGQRGPFTFSAGDLAEGRCPNHRVFSINSIQDLNAFFPNN